MTELIAVSDLPSAIREAELVDLMVDGANAKAIRVAPCLAATSPAPTATQLAEARLILAGAVSRWVEVGTGALQQQTAGPFGMTVDTRQRGGWNLRPNEIADLQSICGLGGGVYTVSLAGPDSASPAGLFGF